MPTLTYPGVYVQEISSGVRPIEIASTSTAAFVGLTEMGPDAATRVTNWTEFQRYYGGFIADGYLAAQRVPVLQQRRRGSATSCGSRARTRSSADVTVQNRAGAPVAGLTFSAQEQGRLGQLPVSADRGRHARPGQRVQDQRAAADRSDGGAGQLRGHHPLGGLRQPEHRSERAPVTSSASSSRTPRSSTRRCSPPTPRVQRGIHRGGFGPTLPLGDEPQLSDQHRQATASRW